jgi:thiol-disulfide isomerase/thioredoxin
MKKILKRCLLGIALLLLGFVTLVVGAYLWDMPPKSDRDFVALKWDWDEALSRHRNLSVADRLADNQKFAERALDLSSKYPGTGAELALLMMVDERVADSDMGQKAGEILLERIASADLKALKRACGYGLPGQLSRERAAPAVFARVERELDHPAAPWLLARVAGTLAHGNESPTPPPGFDDAANLIVDRFVDSPEIVGFCDSFGSGTGGPPWSSRYESHVDRVLQANKHPNIRTAALMAKAQIAQSCETRQNEAETRYRDFLAEFGGHVDPRWKNIVDVQCHWAKLQLEALQFAPIGRPAPELSGIDLEGAPLSLSDSGGKVVLLTFWSSWCGPCMKLSTHEKELAARYAGQPFAILGVNADTDPGHGAKVAASKGFTWPSFRDKRESGQAISEEWRALFPTVYVIDHRGIVRYRASMLPPADLIDELVAAANADRRG